MNLIAFNKNIFITFLSISCLPTKVPAPCLTLTPVRGLQVKLNTMNT